MLSILESYSHPRILAFVQTTNTYKHENIQTYMHGCTISPQPYNIQWHGINSRTEPSINYATDADIFSTLILSLIYYLVRHMYQMKRKQNSVHTLNLHSIRFNFLSRNTSKTTRSWHISRMYGDRVSLSIHMNFGLFGGRCFW